MKKKLALVVTLGNRDLQIHKRSKKKLPPDFQQSLEVNNDQKDYFIIQKKNTQSFWDITQSLYELCSSKPEIARILKFPMIQKGIKKIKKHHKRVPIEFYLFPSYQNPPDRQDTYYVAKLYELANHFAKNKITVLPITANPTNVSEWARLVLTELQKIEHLYEKIYFVNAGGTPQMRTATHFVGLFKPNYVFYNINARNNSIEEDSFRSLENVILKQMVNNMLKVYDYEGIRQLPLQNHQIRELAEKALKIYNLDISNNHNSDNPKHALNKNSHHSQKKYANNALECLNLLLENTRICYIQGRYADVIGRIFRLEEATWYLLLYDFLKSKGYIHENDKIKGKKFEKFLSYELKNKNFFESEFPDFFIENDNQDKVFAINSEISIHSGKNFFYYFFRSVQKYRSSNDHPFYQEFTDFFELYNKDNSGKPYTSNSKLNSLRNNSYLGHGFAGVSQNELKVLLSNEKTVGSDPVFHFLERLKELLKSQFLEKYPEETKFVSPFEEINNEILKWLE